MIKINATHVFDGTQTHADSCLSIDRGIVSSLATSFDKNADLTVNGTIVPGFIDVQVNGGGGYLLNNQPDLNTLIKMSEAHQRFGTTAMLPTVITDNLSTMNASTVAISEALSQQVPGIIGIHFEGPHLDTVKRGIHPASQIRSITDKELSLYCRNDLGKVIVTLAPEHIPTDVIKDLVNQGVIVCLGHSNATIEQAINALGAGATGFTHLYNAMSPLHSRAAGMVGAALLSDTAYAGLIVDLEHVDKYACQLAVKAISTERLMLVTDSMSHIGTNQVSLRFNDEEILRDKNRLSLRDGTLAGSALDMLSAVRNSIEHLNVPFEQALQMASKTPANFLSMPTKGRLQTGSDADFVVLNNNNEITHTFIAGKLVFDANKHTQIRDVI
jgi:N-acetylglucosamine-6-phosphate deacetylase